MNAGPREDSTRVGSAGVVRRQAVDVSPFRRVNQALYLIAIGVSSLRQCVALGTETISSRLVRPLSAPSRPLLSAWLMRSSTQQRYATLVDLLRRALCSLLQRVGLIQQLRHQEEG